MPMCCRYYYADDILENITKVVQEMDERIRQERMEKDVAPTNDAPVIIRGEKGLKLVCQNWGYSGIQNKGVIFNARSESVLDKSMFHEGIYHNRAIIPVKYFYEWNKAKEKNTFTRKDEDVMFLAGFYERFKDGEKFVILTTDANESMLSVHDRMPLILERSQLEDWIYDDKRMEAILKQVPAKLERKAEYEQLSLELDIEN